MNLKANMAFAALLSAGIIAMITGKVSTVLVHPKHLEKDAVTVESTEVSAGGAAAVAMPEPILSMIATADIDRGKGVAKACEACHHLEKGGANAVGPALWGVVGRKKQSHPGYDYSGVLDDQGGDTWTYEELNKFLWKPKAYNKDTKMTFPGAKKPEDRAALIAYLRTLNDSPLPEPTQAQIDQDKKDLTPAAPAGSAGQASAPATSGATPPEKAGKDAPPGQKPAEASKGKPETANPGAKKEQLPATDTPEKHDR